MVVKFRKVELSNEKWTVSKSQKFVLSCCCGAALLLSHFISFHATYSVNTRQFIYFDGHSSTPAKSQEDLILAAENLFSAEKIEVRPSPWFSWEFSSVMPPWMKEYIRWHIETRQQLTHDNWNNGTIRYLVMRCIRLDDKCGGASDRLSYIPFAIMVGHQTKRLLLIKWERPHPLEEFLLPPAGGLDWRVPDFFNMTVAPKPDIVKDRNARDVISRTDLVISMRHQQDEHGRLYYDEHRLGNESTFLQVYPDVWRTVFTPSPAVQYLIDRHMKELNLQPKNYTALHIRAKHRYRDYTNNTKMIQNAANCASQLQPGAPIFVSTDGAQVTQTAIAFGSHAFAGSSTFVTRLVGDKDPLHIDRGTDFLNPRNADWYKYNASQYYDTFVDLFLLAGANCFALGKGGYAKWSLAIAGGNCSIQHDQTKCGSTSLAAFMHLNE